MHSHGASSGLTITNPLVLYRALLARGSILPDPAQLRLALHLQKLYERLKDYEPTIDYQHRLQQLSRVVATNEGNVSRNSIGTRGIWTSLLAQKERRDSLALTRILTNKEAAQQLDSPKGLMLHGEVGTGKSMLVDLFADSLPTQKKRRWHFNTFMLETFARLEQLRIQRFLERAPDSDEHPLLWLARDMILKSPILFLDEFQLPDRASSKIMTNLMTSFFQLGGVLIATSNRMPDELAKAAGVEFAPPPSRIESLGRSLGLGLVGGKSERMYAGKGEFADFLELLKARCDVWEMEGTKDYRRAESETVSSLSHDVSEYSPTKATKTAAFQSELDSSGLVEQVEDAQSVEVTHPKMFFVKPPSTEPEVLNIYAEEFIAAQRRAARMRPLSSLIPWQPNSIRVFGREVAVPRAYNGVSLWTFDELCGIRLGSADYITLASNFHTLILTDVPVLTTLQRNEARRFITLLDALYEAKCKLLTSADAGPDDLFFPEQRIQAAQTDGENVSEDDDQDATYPETFSEAYQDATAPFRPNISSYDNGPDYTHARLQGILAPDALEDDPPNRVRRGIASDCSSPTPEGANEPFEIGHRGPDFTQTGVFTGEDERFAYKRATSRLWEMCGAKWWARSEEGWWRPVPLEVRRWEKAPGDASSIGQGEASLIEQDSVPQPKASGEGMGESRTVDEANDKLLYEHKASPLSTSPFRTHSEPPPKISWTHVWGTMKWGKKAGVWGQGVDGLQNKTKDGQDNGSQK
ncbi:hypothetical protein NA57DRAFT_37394 [Rhizodiscina lignyota]|uniref:AAA+ ATPase domain-containing protein n=1 Tax=Rhizodiscina lignyota TaxID=1504668 RepID=A0A9P4IJY3_9PEZI|nr:hypothetical protein NA57DRAFT_37394 [Rhizodiscina lignyota]